MKSLKKMNLERNYKCCSKTVRNFDKNGKISVYELGN